MTTDIPRHTASEYFKVGGRYENRNGAYEVFSTGIATIVSVIFTDLLPLYVAVIEHAAKNQH